MTHSTPSRRPAHALIPLAACVMAALAASAYAQTPAYPSRAVRIVVPYAPGGIADILSRMLAQRLSSTWSRQVVVENRPGSGGHVGAEAVVKAPADGYTLMLGTIAHNAAFAMYASLPYDPVKDLQPVVLVAESAGVLVVHPQLPVKSVKEFVALARARPGELNYGSAGHGSALHMAAELFRYVAKVDLNHIAYRGSSPAMVDLIGGQIQVMFENIASSLPYVNAKRVRPLGVTSPQRHPSFPELPAIAEAGVPGYSAVPYYTISASAKVPRDIISRINADLSAAIRSPELAPRWAEVGVTPLGGSLESAVQRNVAETEKWTRVIKSANIRAE